MSSIKDLIKEATINKTSNQSNDKSIDAIFEQDANSFECAPYDCPRCHKKIWRFKKVSKKTGNRVGFACPHCGYYEGNNDKDKKHQKLELEARKHDCIGYFKKYSVYSVSGILNKGFKNYIPNNDETKRALATCKRMTKYMLNGQIVHGLLLGNTGVGKTHLTCAVINNLMQGSSYYLKIMFISSGLISEMNKLAINDKEAQNKINGTMSQLSKADLVVLDDLGTEYNTEWNTHLINRIMELRENKNLIVSTNLSDDDITERYSERALSRLNNHLKSNICMFNNTADYRGTFSI